MKWKTWVKNNPDTLVLSDQTGFHRNYSIDPYDGYYNIGPLMFPVGKVRRDLGTKERILGLEIAGNAKAYPLNILTKKPGKFRDSLAGQNIHITVNDDHEIESITNDRDEKIAHIFSYWFAWQAFNPDTAVYQENKK